MRSKEARLFALDVEGWTSSVNRLEDRLSNAETAILFSYISPNIFSLSQWIPVKYVSDIPTLNQNTVRSLTVGLVSKMTNSAIQGIGCKGPGNSFSILLVEL
jgi:hypothetical protein